MPPKGRTQANRGRGAQRRAAQDGSNTSASSTAGGGGQRGQAGGSGSDPRSARRDNPSMPFMSGGRGTGGRGDPAGQDQTWTKGSPIVFSTGQDNRPLIYDSGSSSSDSLVRNRDGKGGGNDGAHTFAEIMAELEVEGDGENDNQVDTTKGGLRGVGGQQQGTGHDDHGQHQRRGGHGGNQQGHQHGIGHHDHGQHQHQGGHDDHPEDDDEDVGTGDGEDDDQHDDHNHHADNHSVDAGSDGAQPEFIQPTTFAGPYRSMFTAQIPPTSNLMELLHNLNCGYLSTAGVPPTLTELKSHAQALTILIKHLTISTQSAMIDNKNAIESDCVDNARAFMDGETFDWLNDLTKRYDGPQAEELFTHHNLPLTSILNSLQTREDATGDHAHSHMIVDDICPLHTAWRTPVDAHSLPYAKHQALIKHANDVLELIDHEYSAKGGLLSILPPKEEKDDRERAESTLLGQFIVYTNRLVERLHDLERLYANAMDALASEAVVPTQALSRLGPDGRQGREMVYPQDRFVLVNAGEDVWQYLNHEFEQKERSDEQVADMYRRQGVSGETLWKQRGGKEYSRGITAIDVVTRYYRLRKDALKTIFVIPAHAEHPGTKVTREMEQQPTVVSVVKPYWPERQSEWEKKHRADLLELKRLQHTDLNLRAEQQVDKSAVKALQYNNDLQTVEIAQLKQDLAQLRGSPDQQAATIIDLQQQLHQCRTHNIAAHRTLDARTASTNKLQTDLTTQQQQFQADRTRYLSEMATTRATLNTEVETARRRIHQLDADQARVIHDLKDELMRNVTRQHQLLAATIETLQEAGAQNLDLDNVVISREVRDRAGHDSAELMRALVDDFVRRHPERFPELVEGDGGSGATGGGSAAGVVAGGGAAGGNGSVRLDHHGRPIASVFGLGLGFGARVEDVLDEDEGGNDSDYEMGE